MTRRFAITALLMIGACASPYAATEPPPSTTPGGDGGIDAPSNVEGGTDGAPTLDGEAPDGAVPKTCNPTSKFGTPVRIGPALSGADEDSDAKPTEDELQMVFTSDRGPAPKKTRIYGANRPSTAVAWSVATPLLENADVLFDANLAPNALHVVYQRGGKTTGARIVVGRRVSTGVEFSEKELELPRTTGQDERDPFVVFGSTDNASYTLLYSQNGATAARDLYVANVDTKDVAVASSPIPELNTSSNERDPVMAKDGQEIFFASDRMQAGVMRIYHATRMPGAGKAFTNVEPVGELTTNGATNVFEAPTWISENRCVLYFSSDRDGTTDVWRAVRSP